MFAEIETYDFAAWVPILEAVAKPARHPRFYELTSNGEWKGWSSCPQLSNEEPTLVKQPQWTQVLRPIGDTESYELETFPGGLHHQRLEDKYIRLLDIQNARFEGNVLQGFRLLTVPLADAPLFDALSYCWGDMRLCTGVLFDTGTGPELVERMFRITEDLATCLVSILMTQNLEDKPKYLWIDQMCINQEDVSERNQQVSLMTEIYKTARQVLVWLGQKSDFTLDDTELPDNPAADTDINGQNLLSWIMNKSVFTRPWFYRLWTFQEVVLAKRIQILVGEDCQQWQSLVEEAYTMDRPTNATRTMLEMNQLTRKLNWLIVGTVFYCRNLMAEAGLIDLQTWLPLIVSTQRCRNPRDKVYSLIGLDYATPGWKVRQDHPSEQGHDTADIELSEPQATSAVERPASPSKRRPDATFHISKLPADFVDYGKPVETVFRDFARLMVESRKSLRFLTFYEHDTTVWFPRFLSSARNRSSGLMELVQNRGQYAASAKRVHLPSAPTDDRALDVMGRTVAVVAEDIAEMPSAIEEFYFNIAEVLNLQDLSRRCWIHVAPTYGKSAEDDWVAAFRKDMIDTIFCHQRDFDGVPPVPLDGKSTADVYTIICALFGLIDGLESVSEVVSKMKDDDKQVFRVELSKRAINLYGRRLVVLDTGHLALVQKGVREGDKVAILHGLEVPCVIRKVEDGNKWQWLGDAFILGLMRGEGVFWEEDDADTFTLL